MMLKKMAASILVLWQGPHGMRNLFYLDKVGDHARGGHSIVKLNTTCETSLLPLYYMP